MNCFASPRCSNPAVKSSANRTMITSPRAYFRLHHWTHWSNTVREAQEVRLVDRVEYLDDGTLDDLVLQRGDAERPQPPIRLRDVRPARRTRPVAPAVDPLMQILKVGLQVPPVRLPRHPIHTRRGLRADRPVGRAQPVQINVMQQRCEPRFLVPSCHFAHTAQPR